ncbi:DUF3558 domain-containing protein [Rhodococcus sp. MTM3W5.2]|uniref:DUF3558 domain-containing protein n=1 Tax=Rhodococcus sp. MTM3W5.2 TaxID=1805827 RepID=UPI001CB92A01|nr:DUF3558 domain-containing protein [Rhodococcus sp. MTM3W5.2]
MRVQLRGLVGVGLVCGALALAGCGSETVAGEAEAVATGAGEPVFSPCDDISDDALRAVEMDPATESRDIIGVKQPGWNVCSWAGPAYDLTLFATTRTIDEVRSNKKNTKFENVDIGGRPGVSYREVSDTEGRRCDVALESRGGTALIRISYLGVDPVVEEPCAVAMRVANDLAPQIPS